MVVLRLPYGMNAKDQTWGCHIQGKHLPHYAMALALQYIYLMMVFNHHKCDIKGDGEVEPTFGNEGLRVRRAAECHLFP